MPNKLSPRYISILNYLEDAKEPVSTNYIAMHEGRNYNSVTDDLRMLVKYKCIKRVKMNQRHAYSYTYVTHNAVFPVDPRKSKFTDDMLVVEGIKPKGVTNDTLLKNIVAMHDPRWKPAIHDKIWMLSSILGKLAEYDCLSVMSGDTINQADIDYERERLIALKEVATKTLMSIENILRTNELWRSSSLSGYFTELIETSDNIEELLNSAREIQSNAAEHVTRSE